MKSLSEKSEVKLDIKTLIGLIAGIITIAGIWFSLTAEISQLKVEVLRMQDDVILNDEFRIKWPRGQLGSLPADSEQYMLIEDLYKQVEKLQENIEMNMSNKLKIEFMEGQISKLLTDVEELKDENREIVYKNGNGQ